MKIRLLSDLHLEFGPYTIVPQEGDGETVLILAGDIHVGNKALPFVEAATEQFKHVLYVMGNHEFYNNDVAYVRQYWQAVGDSIDNLHVLDNGQTVIDGVRFLGSTLWTDFNGRSYTAMMMAKKRMNDYRTIMYQGVRLRPEDTATFHDETVAYFTEELEKEWDGKTVVVTHHLPHPLCINEKYLADHIGNAAYMSCLDKLFIRYDIDVWCHGHTHDNVDIVVPGTKSRIYCNPRGYHGYELNQGFDETFSFELDD